jgi:hypothetical protein
VPLEDGDDCDWNEFDPTPLESWILDDFDWDIEQAYPERGDYWDDSLDGEWDRAGCAAMTSDEARMTKHVRMTNAEIGMVKRRREPTTWITKLENEIPTMLSSSIIAEVERLLAAGHSQREVAQLTGVCRNTINRIAAGKRANRASRRETELSSLPRTLAARCQSCGGMVYPPCKLCRVRARMASRTNRRRSA